MNKSREEKRREWTPSTSYPCIAASPKVDDGATLLYSCFPLATQLAAIAYSWLARTTARQRWEEGDYHIHTEACMHGAVLYSSSMVRHGVLASLFFLLHLTCPVLSCPLSAHKRAQ